MVRPNECFKSSLHFLKNINIPIVLNFYKELSVLGCGLVKWVLRKWTNIIYLVLKVGLLLLFFLEAFSRQSPYACFFGPHKYITYASHFVSNSPLTNKLNYISS